jgi:hypothetical protein
MVLLEGTMVKRFSERFGRHTHDRSVFDRISNVEAHALPSRIAQQQVLSTFTDRLLDLGPPDQLITRGRSLAILEIALNGDAAARRHTYHPRRGDRFLVLRDDTGGKALVWTGPAGSVVRGFDYHSEMAPGTQRRRSVWPGVLDHFPPSLADCPHLDIAEGVENVTFCYWWFSGGPWMRGPVTFPSKTDTDPDGSWHLLRTVSSDKEALRFLDEEYGSHFSDDILDDFARPRVLHGMLQTLPLDRPLDNVVDELNSRGYVT